MNICAITTVEITMTSFVIPAMRVLRDNGCDVTLMCSMTDEFYEKYSQEFHCINLPMKRGMSPTDMLKIPLKMKKIFEQEKFDLVQYATPNASLYASVGAKWAKIPARVYCQWGIRYVGSDGITRWILKQMEHLTCVLSTHIRPASWKNRDFAVSEGLYKTEKGKAIGDGGTIGIDLTQFDINQKPALAEDIRNTYPALQNKIVYCFVGRLNRDKGVFELLEAFQKLEKERNDVALMLVGDMEGQLPAYLPGVHEDKNIVFTGFTREVPKFMAASDVLIHPSYREGFSMVIQQGMAMELPVMTTDIPGPSEVIEVGKTGLLVQVKDVETLYEGMKQMAENPKMRETFGKAGRIRVQEKFTRERMLQLTLEDRMNILNS